MAKEYLWEELFRNSIKKARYEYEKMLYQNQSFLKRLKRVLEKRIPEDPYPGMTSWMLCECFIKEWKKEHKTEAFSAKGRYVKVEMDYEMVNCRPILSITYFDGMTTYIEKYSYEKDYVRDMYANNDNVRSIVRGLPETYPKWASDVIKTYRDTDKAIRKIIY